MIKPDLIRKFFKKQLSRKKISIFSLIIFIFLFIAFGATYDDNKNKQPDASDKTEKEVFFEKSPSPITSPTPKTSPTTTSNAATGPASDTSSSDETLAERDKMIAKFKEYALNKWGDDYEMVRYEIDKQTEAYDWVMQQTEYPEIMNRAKQKWGIEYDMVKYEYQKQVEAYESL
jgi:hypothetical protein